MNVTYYIYNKFDGSLTNIMSGAKDVVSLNIPDGCGYTENPPPSFINQIFNGEEWETVETSLIEKNHVPFPFDVKNFPDNE